MTIMITGAAGQLGRLIIEQLRQRLPAGRSLPGSAGWSKRFFSGSLELKSVRWITTCRKHWMKPSTGFPGCC